MACDFPSLFRFPLEGLGCQSLRSAWPVLCPVHGAHEVASFGSSFISSFFPPCLWGLRRGCGRTEVATLLPRVSFAAVPGPYAAASNFAITTCNLFVLELELILKCTVMFFCGCPTCLATTRGPPHGPQPTAPSDFSRWRPSSS